MIRNLSVLSLAVGAATGTAPAQPTIERLAPENSVFVAGVENCQKSLEALKRTGLWALWQSEEVQDLMEEPLDEFNDELDDVLEELEVERADLSAPEGPIGLALFPPKADDANRSPGFLVMADYGANAPQIAGIVDALIKKAEEEQDVRYREQELLGRTVLSFDMSTVDLGAAGEEGMDLEAGDDFMPGPALPGPAELIEKLDQVHYVRDGGRFFVTSHLDALRDALEAVDQDGRTAFDQRADFREALGQLGSVDGYGVLLTRDLPDMLGDEPDPMALMVQGMLMSFLGDIRALAVGVKLDTSDAMVEETFAVYMPNGKSGLTALLDLETPRGKLPPFARPDAIAYSRCNFKFNGVMEFLRNLGQTNPMLAGQIDQMMMEMGPELEQVLSALGPDVHTVATLSRPISLASLKTLYAIRSSKPDQVEGVLARHAADFGLETREILGHTIYTMRADPMMGMPGGDGYSVGFSGAYVMAGNTSVVEDALRASARAAGRTLADDPAYGRAVKKISAASSVGWGVADIVGYLEYFKDWERLMQEEWIQQMQQWDPEQAQQMRAELEDQAGAPWEDFDLDLLRQHIGPIAWEIRSRKDGFVGRYLIMAP